MGQSIERRKLRAWVRGIASLLDRPIIENAVERFRTKAVDPAILP
jgi:hypothetical protein